MPQPRARRSRMLLVGLPVFAVFAAFSAIVWLAYEHGAQGPPTGEAPLIKAPTMAIKLPPDQAGSAAVADQGEVGDLLTDSSPSDQPERLLPPPEQPQAPVAAAQEPDDGSGDVAAVAPPTPGATAPATTGPATGATATGPNTGGPTTSASTSTGLAATGPNTAGPTTGSPAANGAAAPRPVAAAPPQATPAPGQVASSPGKPAPAPAQVATAPAQAAPAPAQVATAPAEQPRETPLAVERQSTAPTGAAQPSGAPQPTPKEAEAALDALLAEVTAPTDARPTPPAPDGVQPAPGGPAQTRAPATPAPATVSELPSPSTSPAPRPAPQPPTPLAPPATVSPPAGRGTDVTAIAPDQPGTRAPTGGATTTATPAPSSTPTLETGPTNGVAALEGGYRIQLAAVRDESDARRAWDLYLVDLGPVLRGVQPFIERAETANGVFYRVQIGPFANLQEAESLCDELKRRNASCFVIRR